MTWFLLAAALLTVAVMAILLRPLLRPVAADAEEAPEPTAALYRRQLAAIDEELAEGRLASEEAQGMRAEITRRLLGAAEKEASRSERGSGGVVESRWRFGAAVAIAGLLPAVAMAVYFAVGAPIAVKRNAARDAVADHGTAELAAAVQRIKTHLEVEPTDLKGWTMLGRTLAALGRFPEARDAYTHAIALAPANSGLHAEFGEVLVLETQGAVTAAAEAQFAKAPADPRSRYYMAEAALQRGDPSAAKRQFQALLADAPADAPWRQTVADRLAELSAPGTPPTASVPGANAAVPGPSAQDVAAAQALSPQERQTMIRGMVDRLAQRLQQHPDDKAGWQRLAHAYDVLGEPEKAKAALARAAAVSAPPPGAAAAAPAAPSAPPPR